MGHCLYLFWISFWLRIETLGYPDEISRRGKPGTVGSRSTALSKNVKWRVERNKRIFTRDVCGFWHQLLKSGNGETWPDSSSWEVGLGLLVGHKLNLSQMCDLPRKWSEADLAESSIYVFWVQGRKARKQFQWARGEVMEKNYKSEWACCQPWAGWGGGSGRLVSHLVAARMRTV